MVSLSNPRGHFMMEEDLVKVEITWNNGDSTEIAIQRAKVEDFREYLLKGLKTAQISLGTPPSLFFNLMHARRVQIHE